MQGDINWCFFYSKFLYMIYCNIYRCKVRCKRKEKSMCNYQCIDLFVHSLKPNKQIIRPFEILNVEANIMVTRVYYICL